MHDNVQLSVAEHVFVCQVILQKTYDGIISSWLPNDAILKGKRAKCGTNIDLLREATWQRVIQSELP